MDIQELTTMLRILLKHAEAVNIDVLISDGTDYGDYMEIFLTRGGKLQFNWARDDMVSIGLDELIAEIKSNKGSFVRELTIIKYHTGDLEAKYDL